MGGEAVETMLGHLEKLGSAYGAAFLAAVPGPESAAPLGMATAATILTRRGRCHAAARR
jgi:hypothetical protein